MMIIYNVTINIDASIHDEWLAWIKEHIPQVLATGKSFELILPKDKLKIFEAHKNEILQASIQSLYKIRD